MASMLKSACIILLVFLSLGFSLAHRLLLDQTNGGKKNSGPFHHEAVQQQDAKREGFGVGHGTGSGSGQGGGGPSGDGFRTGVQYGSGSVGHGTGSGSGPGGGGPSGHEFRTGVLYSSGSVPESVPSIIIPIPQIPEIIGVPGRVISSCVRGGHTDGNDNGIEYFEPVPPFEHRTPGGSVTGAVKVVQEATHIVSEPYPPDVAHSVPYPPDVAHWVRYPPPPSVAHSVPYPPDVAHWVRSPPPPSVAHAQP